MHFNIVKHSNQSIVMSRFCKIFSNVKCAVIGMIHLKALPGTPLAKHSVSQIIDHACEEAMKYGKSGVDGVIVENMFDIPYVLAKDLGPEVTAVMTRVCSEVKKTVGKIPCGVQILAGNNVEATAVAFAAGLQFVRVESYVFSHVADEGLMNACAGTLLRYAKNIGAKDILYLSDIKKKHSSHAITADVSLSQMAKAAEFFMSDGVIITGVETGDAPSVESLKDVQKTVKLPVLIGSGVTIDNINKFSSADGVIVGSHFKDEGHWMGNLDCSKIAKFMEMVIKLR